VSAVMLRLLGSALNAFCLFVCFVIMYNIIYTTLG
jgi:hypothetical protein